MPYEWMKFTDTPEIGGSAKAEYGNDPDGNDLIDYIANLKERRGSSTHRCTIDTADTKFLEYRWDCGAASGDNRGIYNRLYLTGAGTGGGESLRSFTTIEAAMGTAHGAHLSLNFGDVGEGSLSGLGVAGRCTLHIPDAADWTGGTLAAVQAEIYSDGAASDPDGLTELSFIRVVNDGNAAGIADVDDDSFLLSIQGGAIGDGNLVEVAADETSYSHNIRIKVGETTLYLMLADDRD